MNLFVMMDQHYCTLAGWQDATLHVRGIVGCYRGISNICGYLPKFSHQAVLGTYCVRPDAAQAYARQTDGANYVDREMFSTDIN